MTAATTRSYAAPTCSSRPAPHQASIELPWAQARYAPDRLAVMATGEGVTVAVIDSGVSTTHPQLKGRVLRGTDLLDRGGDGTLDCDGHGTAVASIIAATRQSGTQFRGLATRARILPVRVSEQQIIGGKESGRTVTAKQFADAIRWAVDHGANVLNLSVVLYEDDPAVRSAIEYAVAKNVVVVAAAGNLHENGDPRPYPAAYDGVLGVGAIGADGTRQAFSQVGSYVDVVAPGGGVLAAAVGGGHAQQNGTSYAAPFVAATAALILDYRPELRAQEVIARIISTADPAAGGRRSDSYGSGVLNPYRAVTETRAVGRPEPPAPLPADRVDPAAAAQQERRAQSRERSLLLAAVGGAAATLVVLLALVLPRGSRRRWRPAETA
ncbi:type VII secretion-associated serine protease mycosin [Micromonospora sp. NPDC049679]|uniref:type VII secretion-associated serine protease mycosin n=1 Tax=Micromonospora sp. NPDC049679 TaxID=3155920 RepID=UPI0034091CE7